MYLGSSSEDQEDLYQTSSSSGETTIFVEHCFLIITLIESKSM